MTKRYYSKNVLLSQTVVVSQNLSSKLSHHRTYTFHQIETLSSNKPLCKTQTKKARITEIAQRIVAGAKNAVDDVQIRIKKNARKDKRKKKGWMQAREE